ncbi:hypothetical protein [Shewanella sp. S1-49-MNA-CIBAN-0167]|uniref:hypothetical protein n=1 Tax=Shewanella sp. S1-49-MNA-CIBAN-0167 TaxID=3140468 RepID=UPI0033214726
MKKLLPLVAVITLAACSSTVDTQSTPLANNDAIPDWVLLPLSDSGLASSSCVPWSGNMSTDRAQAIAAARADLVQQVQIKASVMDRLYQRKTQSDKLVNVGGTFEQVSKQVAEQNLSGSIPQKVAFARLDGVKQLCTFVVMKNTEETFDNMVEQSGKRLDPGSREALYEEFRAQKAMKELEKELDTLNKASI